MKELFFFRIHPLLCKISILLENVIFTTLLTRFDKKQVKNKIQQIKNKQSSDADMDIQNVIFDKMNTIVLPYFDQRV